MRIKVDGTGPRIIPATLLDILGTSQIKHRLELLARIPITPLNHARLHHHHPTYFAHGVTPRSEPKLMTPPQCWKKSPGSN
jgi:hypothetical protein